MQQELGELVRVSPETFSVRRQRRGRGFVYLDEDGQSAGDEIAERARSLVIPPAWRDVLICSDPLGHIQAVGIDARGRKQYLYHPQFRQQQDLLKFEAMNEFAARLPALREQVDRDLRRHSLSRERVISCAIHLLDLGTFRVGRETYLQNGTYGLSTLRRDHVRLRSRGVIEFDFRAKSGKQRQLTIRDARAARTLERIFAEDPTGEQLFSYLENGWWVDVRSFEVNDRIKELIGEEFSAKDFRTWNATTLAACRLAVYGPVESSSARKKVERQVCKEVSELLGNTPAICRSSYIDPRLFSEFERGVTIEDAVDEISKTDWPFLPQERPQVETAVVELLATADSSAPATTMVDDLTAQVRAVSSRPGRKSDRSDDSLLKALQASLKR